MNIKFAIVIDNKVIYNFFQERAFNVDYTVKKDKNMKKTKVIILSSLFALTFGGILTSCGENNHGSTESSKQNVGDTDVGLTVSKTEVTLNVGEEETITASTNDDSLYTLSWTSSNKNVAKVRNGVITAIADGEATITVNARKNKSITILQSKEIKVVVTSHSITLNETNITISLSSGTNTYQLSATVNDDNKNVTWSSDHEDIASVSQSGLVTGHKSGKATITVTNGTLSASCVVTVRANDFSFAKEKVIATLGTNLTLELKGTPSADATYSIDDETIASVTNGIVTPKKIGMSTIHLASKEDGVDATCVLIVKETGDAEELMVGKKAIAAQNPTKWVYLCENEENVQIESTPTIEGGLINVNILRVGDADGNLKGANYFYLRYQPDATGGYSYKETLYFYAEKEAKLSINGGSDTDYPAGLNKVELTFDSSDPADQAPTQIKFKCTGKFDILPIFEKTGEVKRLTLSEKKKTLDLAGEKEFTLTARIPGEENPQIEWSSNNEAVATVENGKVTALSKGVATITAISGSFSASCDVTVIDSTVEDNRIDLPSGNNATVVKAENRGKWFYFDGKGSKTSERKISQDGKTIDFVITSNDGGKDAFSYLRYAPKDDGTTTVTYKFAYTGTDTPSVDITGASAEKKTIGNLITDSEGTYTFDFDSSATKPFQFKLKAIGSYKVTVGINTVAK